MLQHLLSNYGWVVGLGAAGTGALAWALGVPALLRILASVVDVLSPVAKGIVEKAVEGLGHIMKSIPAVLTTAGLMYGVHLYDKTQYIPKHNHVVTQLQVCQAEVKRVTKSKAPVSEPELWELPFRWPF